MTTPNRGRPDPDSPDVGPATGTPTGTVTLTLKIAYDANFSDAETVKLVVETAVRNAFADEHPAYRLTDEPELSDISDPVSAVLYVRPDGTMTTDPAGGTPFPGQTTNHDDGYFELDLTGVDDAIRAAAPDEPFPVDLSDPDVITFRFDYDSGGTTTGVFYRTPTGTRTVYLSGPSAGDPSASPHTDGVERDQLTTDILIANIVVGPGRYDGTYPHGADGRPFAYSATADRTR